MNEQARELAYKEWWDYEAREYLLSIFKHDHAFVDKLLIRYLFVKCMDKTDKDDPLFIYKHTSASLELIERDMRYLKLNKPSANQVTASLDLQKVY